jgi:predicted DCC family thiol-disulfide oxidoreductase YuxK
VVLIGYLIPRFIRDGLYRFIANNRYRWFGKQSQCRVPSPELKDRFLE